ncbi:STAS domain-containing protein [Hydrogenophaga pseudoflava]|uniref:STAS domain-containing protein n=1 Tax=Hydrogenophaga pseudoflava TaxID=47421 RepID=UPI0027E4EDD2|nr:STAS domain-containing protein [Hydrogenophaga pseudoflava]MDQ7743464.1 STAS domain-containing protein [Hydrogenophaga pseudoflava]
MSDTAAIPLPEQLTLSGAAQTLQRLREALLRQTGPTVVLNAEPLRVFDTSAVAVLLELRNALLTQGKTLQVARMPQRLRALVTLYGVAELLPA